MPIGTHKESTVPAFLENMPVKLFCRKDRQTTKKGFELLPYAGSGHAACLCSCCHIVALGAKRLFLSQHNKKPTRKRGPAAEEGGYGSSPWQGACMSGACEFRLSGSARRGHKNPLAPIALRLFNASAPPFVACRPPVVGEAALQFAFVRNASAAFSFYGSRGRRIS